MVERLKFLFGGGEAMPKFRTEAEASYQPSKPVPLGGYPISHAAGIGSRNVPDDTRGWNRVAQRSGIADIPGRRFCGWHKVPHWLGEFGSANNGPSEEVPYRLTALGDRLGLLKDLGFHWTICTFKDVRVIGWVTVDPESENMQRIKPVLMAKTILRCDRWRRWLPAGPIDAKVTELAGTILRSVPGTYVSVGDNTEWPRQVILSSYAANVLHPAFRQVFKGLWENKIDRILASFAFTHSLKRQGLIDVATKYPRNREGSAK